MRQLRITLWWQRKKNQKRVKLGIFYDVQISRMEKMHHVQGQRLSIKCAHRGEGELYIDIKNAHGLFIPDWKMKICSLPSIVHI